MIPMPGETPPGRTAEELCWPELADVTIVSKVFHMPLPEALDLSPIECDRLLAIEASRSIPSDRRVGGEVEADTAQLDAMYGGR